MSNQTLADDLSFEIWVELRDIQLLSMVFSLLVLLLVYHLSSPPPPSNRVYAHHKLELGVLCARLRSRDGGGGPSVTIPI